MIKKIKYIVYKLIILEKFINTKLCNYNYYYIFIIIFLVLLSVYSII